MPLTLKGLNRGRRVVQFFLGLVSALGLSAAPDSRAATGARAALSDSIKEVAAVASPGAALDSARPTVVRTSLSAAELAAPMEFEVALKMRNFRELQARIAKGELISQTEMSAKYYPLSSDYEAALAWIEGLGLTVTNRFDNHLSFFVQGSVGRVRDALQVNFARVAYRGGEYTSALSAPTVPKQLVPSLVGINGLQPHIRFRPHRFRLRPSDASTSSPPYGPNNLADAYDAKGLSVNGADQTIGILGYAFPAPSDLEAFWSTYSVAQQAGVVTNVSVGNGPSTNPDPNDVEEITLDVEWASSVASGAAIRVYGTQANDLVGNMALAQILSDLPAQPHMRQICICYGQNENEYSPSDLATTSAYLASIASAGVTLFISSGDGGSNPDPNTGGLNSLTPLQVCYPASDPSATGVGGTSLSAPLPNSLSYTESVWNSEGGASGGGASTQFTRPSWQSGLGVPQGTQRLVPDVAASADPDFGADVVIGGIHDTVGGTSWSTPVWAGYCALLNQARLSASSGLGPVGLLNPKIYPLLGGDCFHDITFGGNGAFSAQVGYDECTGIGSPDVGHLVQALSIASPLSVAPTITTQPSGKTVQGGQGGSFSVAAASFGPETYQWQYLPAGSTSWVSLANGAGFSGTTTGTLTVNVSSDAMNGAQFRCVVSDVGSSTTSQPAVLTVPQVAPPQPTFWAGSLSYSLGYNGASLQPTLLDLGNPVPPVSYQWYQNGVLVPGATSTTFLLPDYSHISNGDYLLTATNPGGTVVAGQAAVQVLSQEGDYGWGSAQQQGAIVYFQFSYPSQILRYDLSAGAWLAPVAVDSIMWALCPAPEGVYVSLGGTVRLYSLDLSTYTTVATSAIGAQGLFVSGDYFYLVGSSDGGLTWSVSAYRREGASFATTSTFNVGSRHYSGAVASGPLSTLYADIGGEIASWPLASDGTVESFLPVAQSTPGFRSGTLAFVFPDGKHVCDDTGLVWNGEDLSYAGSLGPSFNDLVFFPDGNAAVLRDDVVTLYAAGTLAELGRCQLPGPAYRLFVNGGMLTAFSWPGVAGGTVGVASVTEARLVASPRPVASSVDPASTTFVPDDGFVGSDGLLYLLSRVNRSIFAWSPSTRQYVKSMPLQGSPVWMSYSESLNRIYLDYDDYRVTKIDLGTSDAESFYANLPDDPIWFAAAGSQLFVHQKNQATFLYTDWLYDSSGNLKKSVPDMYDLLKVYWDPATGGLYSLAATGLSEQIWMLPVGPGTLGAFVAGPGGPGGNPITQYPIRFSTDGSLLATGSGTIYNATTLANVGILGAYVVDTAWLGSTVTALSSSGSASVVRQAEAPGFAAAQGNPTAILGTPLRIWPTPDGHLVVLTVLDGTADLTVLNGQAQVVSTNGPPIAIQPSGQTMIPGSTVEFTAEAAGSATYQWQFNGTNLADGADVGGATGPQLVLSNVSPADAGSYTCVVSDATGSSTSAPAALAVQSSASPGAASSISSRAFVGTGDNILIGGFYVTGSTSCTVLVQAIGPALAAAPYNVSGTLQHPSLAIHQNQNGKDVVLYSNTGWGSSPVLLAAAAAVFAQPVLKPGANDSEVLLTLPPGGYTAEVTGADGGTGVALCGIYQLP